MELDSLLGSQRWSILEILAVRPSSPLELASKLKTSVAYMSQQLKLLEAADIVHKEKTGIVLKGKPRNVYHVSKEFLHLTLLAKGNPKRKSIVVNEYQKIILNIWLSPDEKTHYLLEKIFWSIEEELNNMKGIFLDLTKPKKILYILSDSKKLGSKISSIAKQYSTILDVVIEQSEVKKDFSNYYILYDPLFLTREKNLKGGDM